jgi:hypothetical protein
MKETFAKQYDAAKFTWKNSEGIAVASELGLKAGVIPYDYLYDDSVDVGLTLKSLKTGVVKPFVLVEVTKHNGETVKWIFESLDTPKLIVTIYND